MAHTVVSSSCSSVVRQHLTPTCSNVTDSSLPWSGSCSHYRNVAFGSSRHFQGRALVVLTSVPRNQSSGVQLRASAEAGPDVEILRDEEWEKLMRKETAERERQRQEDQRVERSMEAVYKSMTKELQSFPEEEVKAARKLVANLIRSGEKVEEMIVEAADNGELTPVVLLVIKIRLDLALHDDERDKSQALDLLYRRVETEMLSRQASPAMQLLNELLHLNDGVSREEWLRRSRLIMLKIFPPEDAFSILGGPGFDLRNQHGPIEMPEEEDDILLRIDFIREVDAFLKELEAEPKVEVLQGFDAPSVAVRLHQEERIRAIEQVRDLRNLAIKLQR
ncbi:unnamed protein product [Calypogeia fissa]